MLGESMSLVPDRLAELQPEILPTEPDGFTAALDVDQLLLLGERDDHGWFHVERLEGLERGMASSLHPVR